MSDKPGINFDTEDENAGFEDDYLSEHTDRNRVKFNTRIRADLYEKLRAAAFWLDEATITGLVEDAVRDHISSLEEEQGSQFEILDPHRVDDS